jgi:quinol monooxygenase YgiN
MSSFTQSKHGLFGSLKAQPGQADALTALLLEASQLVSTAPGCHIYLVSRDPQDEAVVWVTEVWDTEQDHANSLHVTGVRELISRAMPLLAGPPEKGRVLQVLGGKGLD